MSWWLEMVGVTGAAIACQNTLAKPPQKPLLLQKHFLQPLESNTLAKLCLIKQHFVKNKKILFASDRLFIRVESPVRIISFHSLKRARLLLLCLGVAPLDFGSRWKLGVGGCLLVVGICLSGNQTVYSLSCFLVGKSNRYSKLLTFQEDFVLGLFSRVFCLFVLYNFAMVCWSLLS